MSLEHVKRSLMKSMDKIEWTLRDGSKTTLAKMDCGHLRNVILMPERKVDDNTLAMASSDEHYAAVASREVHDLGLKIEFLKQYLAIREELNYIVSGP